MLLNYRELAQKLVDRGEILLSIPTVSKDMSILDMHTRELPDSELPEEMKNYLDSNSEYNLVGILGAILKQHNSELTKLDFTYKNHNQFLQINYVQTSNK